MKNRNISRYEIHNYDEHEIEILEKKKNLSQILILKGQLIYADNYRIRNSKLCYKVSRSKL